MLKTVLVVTVTNIRKQLRPFILTGATRLYILGLYHGRLSSEFHGKIL